MWTNQNRVDVYHSICIKLSLNNAFSLRRRRFQKSTWCFAHTGPAPSRGKKRKGNGCYAGYNTVERKVRDKWKLLTLNMTWTLFAQVFFYPRSTLNTFCESLFSMSFSLDRGSGEQRTCAWHRGLKALRHLFGVKDLEEKYPPHFQSICRRG